MIVQENIIIGTRELIKTYSDENKYIIQNETGVQYSEAVDVLIENETGEMVSKYTYTESDEEIKTEEIPQENINSIKNIIK